MRGRNCRGEITVFLALTLSLVMSFLLSLVQSAAVQTGKNESRLVSSVAMDCVFSEYNKPLWELYDLLMIDHGYGSGREADSMADRFSYYVSLQTEGESSRMPVGPFWSFDLRDVSLEGMTLATDNGGEAVKEQAVKYLESKYGLNWISTFADLPDLASFLDGAEREWTMERHANASELTRLEQAKEESGIPVDEEAEAADPLDDVRMLQDRSVWDLLLGSDIPFSGKTISLDNAPSHRTLHSGFGYQLSGGGPGVSGTVSFREYLLDHCTNAVKDEDSGDHVLDYETEYVLAGKSVDKDNLEAVFNRLLMIREAVNFAYLASDGAKQEEAAALAVVLAGYFGIPPLVTAVKWAILLAWAFGESVLDLRMLMNGKKIALVKSAASWKLPLSGLATLAYDGPMEDEPGGISYEGFLRILLYLQDPGTQMLRFYDVAESNVRLAGDDHGFQIDRCVSAVYFQTSWELSGGVAYEYPCCYAYQ